MHIPISKFDIEEKTSSKKQMLSQNNDVLMCIPCPFFAEGDIRIIADQHFLSLYLSLYLVYVSNQRVFN